MSAPPAPVPVRRRVVAWLVGAPTDPRPARVLRALSAFFLAVGLFLRAHGYLWAPPAFWLDEATWAMNLVEQPLIELCIRPIGFMAVSRLLAQVFSLNEPVLRAMPWLAGIAVLFMAPPLARRLFTSATAQLLFVGVIALHPCAIDFSKEFKPYSISLALHLGLLLLTLRYADTGRGKHLAWLLGTALVGGLFAQDLVFAYPGVFLFIGWRALRSNRAHIRPIVLGAGVILLMLLAQYVFIWRNFPASETNDWGDKYNVFFMRDKNPSYLAWWVERYDDMAAFPGFRRRFWKPDFFRMNTSRDLREVDRVVWVVLHLVGLVTIFRRERERALLLVLPLAVLWSFNFLRLWPIGVFRANIFIIAYQTAIACKAFDWPRRALAAGPAPPRFADSVPAAVLVLAPFLFMDPMRSMEKRALTYASEFPAAVKTLVNVKRGTRVNTKEALVLDRRSCDPFRFYTEVHPRSRSLRKIVRQQFQVKCIPDDARYRRALMQAVPDSPGHVWTILHAPKPVLAMIKHGRLPGTQLTYEEKVGAHTLMAFTRPPYEPPPSRLRPRPAGQGSVTKPVVPEKAEPPVAPSATAPDSDTPEDNTDVPEVSPGNRF